MLYTSENISEVKLALTVLLLDLFPYVSVTHSTLGGVENVSIYIRVSTVKKEIWAGGIFQNSPYLQLSLMQDGSLECFSSGYKMPKFRKCKCKDLGMVSAKLEKYLINNNLGF